MYALNWTVGPTLRKRRITVRTSEDALELGLYVSDCCNQELIFDIADTFCRCPNCESPCNWELESRITPIDALDIDIDIEMDEPEYSVTCAVA